jgi:predicted enzyme related to lactoylglutathione lyase
VDRGHDLMIAAAPCARRATGELKAAGVEFLGPPTERPYGIEAMMKDDSGNVFSMVQPMAYSSSGGAAKAR